MHKKWYSAALIVTSSIDNDPQYKPLVDLQVRLIKAVDAEEAYKEALRLGVAEETNYKNAIDEIVRWHFEGLHDLQELSAEELSSGTEVFSIRSGNAIEDLVVDKDRLTVFWIDANKHKKAIEILLEDE